MMTHSTPAHAQRGAVLIISLIFLVMLTVVAVVANQSTVLETRMSTNAIVKARAVEASEALRTASNDLIDNSCYHRGWPDSATGLSGSPVPDDEFSIPTGLKVTSAKDWCVENETSETLMDPATWVSDMTLLVDGNSDSDYADDGDQQAELYAYLIDRSLNAGSATAMSAGYLGEGQGSAKGGGLVFLDLRSAGASAANSTGVTGSIYRYVIR